MDWKFIITTILAVLFFGVSTILALRLTRRKKLVWAYVTKKIIGLDTNAPPELKLVFNEKQVKDVFRTTLIFFNRGNEAIRKNDVTKCVCVDFDGAVILREPNMRAVSNKEIGFTGKQAAAGGNSVIELDFQYLDHNDGAVVEVLHTACDKPRCVGNIIGVGEPRYIGEFVLRPAGHSMIKRTRVVISLAIGIVLALSMIVLMAVTGQLGRDSTRALLLVATISAGWYAGFLAQVVSTYCRHAKFPKWSRVEE